MIKLKQVIHDIKTNSVEATWVDADDDNKQVKCHSYADVQMAMFRADVAQWGGDIVDYEALIALVESMPTVQPIKTATQIQAEIVVETQARLDAFAQERGYDGILSACTYAASSVPKFATDGQAAQVARDATWAALYTLMGAVMAGAQPMPAGFADVAPILPTLVWPA